VVAEEKHPYGITLAVYVLYHVKNVKLQRMDMTIKFSPSKHGIGRWVSGRQSLKRGTDIRRRVGTSVFVARAFTKDRTSALDAGALLDWSGNE